MDGECACCGRQMGGGRQMFCDDCRTTHTVCAACAAEVTESDGLRLVA